MHSVGEAGQDGDDRTSTRDDAARSGTEPGGGAARPAQFARRVLLVVSGLSPQVISETVFALAVSAPPAERAMPTEVRVVTTSTGADRVRSAFLGPGSYLRRLSDDHGLPPIDFQDDHIQVVRGVDGEALADIRTAADNARVADALTEQVRSLTADPLCALHVSLAGGRKTMAYYAGYALSLFGRAQDRLSHVLVSAPFESSPDFYYPPPVRGSIGVRVGEAWADAVDADVQLVLVPFVRLRHGLPPALRDRGVSFAEVVAAAAGGTGEPRLALDARTRSLSADGVTIRLTPMQFALMVVLAHRARHGRPPLAAPPRDAHDDAWAVELLADLRQAVGTANVPVHVDASLRRDCSGAKLSPHWSDIRKLLRTRLAPCRDALYFDDGPAHRGKRYRVPLPPAAIEIIRPSGSSGAITASLPNAAPSLTPGTVVTDPPTTS